MTEILASFYIAIDEGGTIMLGVRNTDVHLKLPLTPDAAEDIAAQLLVAARVSRGEIMSAAAAALPGRAN
jgi:hypothetical protein